MDKISKETQELAIKIFSLALEINDAKTQKAYTENKPTIMVDFFGHTAQLDVRIHTKGWNNFGKIKSYSFNQLDKNPTKKLQEIIEVLEKIKKEWC